MMSGPMFIVFEGLDGSGKSTCAAGLAARIGAELMTTPTVEVRRYRDDLISCFGASEEACQLFYLATVFSASAAVKRVLSEGRPVVLDRYFLSTQAYAAFRGSRLDIDQVQHLLLPADVTIFMDTALETRIERLSSRGASAADLETVTAEADTRLREEHSRRASLSVVGRFVSVRGDGGGPATVLERVVAELELSTTWAGRVFSV